MVCFGFPDVPFENSEVGKNVYIFFLLCRTKFVANIGNIPGFVLFLFVSHCVFCLKSDNSY